MNAADTDLSTATVGEHVHGAFCVVKKQSAQTKNNQEYLQIELVNARRQRVGGKVWSQGLPAWAEIEEGDAVTVDGLLEEGFPKGSAPQLKVRTVERLESPHAVQAVMNPVYEGDAEALKAEFWQLVAEIRHPGIRRFVQRFFGPDGVPFEEFSTCPAAKGNHHAYLHGLLEHTLEVTRVALRIAEQPAMAPFVNRDLVIAGALVHDAGKVKEYVWQHCPIGMSPLAGLTNHIGVGAQISFVVARLHGAELGSLGFTDEHRVHIEHVILSHHGTREWGALVVPKTPTAQVIHQADMVSAHVRQQLEVLRTAVPDAYGRVNGGFTYKQGLMIDVPRYEGPETELPDLETVATGPHPAAPVAWPPVRAPRPSGPGPNGAAGPGTAGEGAGSAPGGAEGAVALPEPAHMAEEAEQLDRNVFRGSLNDILVESAPLRGGRRSVPSGIRS